MLIVVYPGKLWSVVVRVAVAKMKTRPPPQPLLTVQSKTTPKIIPVMSNKRSGAISPVGLGEDPARLGATVTVNMDVGLTKYTVIQLGYVS